MQSKWADQQDPIPKGLRRRPQLRPQTRSLPLFRMVEKPDRGRAFVAARRIEQDQVILINSPNITYPNSLSLSCIPVFCSYCFHVLPSKSFLCLSCHVVRFCSAQSLTKSHPPLLCQALPSLLSKPTCSPELLFLLAAYSFSLDLILQLLSHHSNSSFSPDDDFVRSLNSELRSHLPSVRFPPHFSRQITAYLLSIEKTNSFPIFNPKHPQFDGCGIGRIHAYGLYFQASFLNHDCMPNVCPFNYVDDHGRENNTSLIFRALHEIQEGTEMCVSYVALDMGY